MTTSPLHQKRAKQTQYPHTRPPGLEPRTFGFENRCSIHWAMGAKFISNKNAHLLTHFCNIRYLPTPVSTSAPSAFHKNQFYMRWCGPSKGIAKSNQQTSERAHIQSSGEKLNSTPKKPMFTHLIGKEQTVLARNNLTHFKANTSPPNYAVTYCTFQRICIEDCFLH